MENKQGNFRFCKSKCQATEAQVLGNDVHSYYGIAT